MIQLGGIFNFAAVFLYLEFFLYITGVLRAADGKNYFYRFNNFPVLDNFAWLQNCRECVLLREGK